MWIRKPNFNAVRNLDYNEYWKVRGFSINSGLKERELIMRDMIPSGVRVVDIGCGNSRLALELKAKGCDVSVADISDIVLDEFKKIGIPTFRVDVRNPSTIAEIGKSHPVDYAIMSEVLEHVPNSEEVVENAKQIAEYLVITIPNSAFFWFRLGLMFRGRFFTQWVHHPSEHVRFWSHIDFLDWLSAMGLTVVTSRASNGPKFLRDLNPNLFGFQIVYLCKKNTAA